MKPDSPSSLAGPVRGSALAAAVGLGAAAGLATIGMALPSPAAAQSPASPPPASGSGASPEAEATAPAPGPAEGDDDRAGSIDGFWDLPWHADSAAVAARLGPPITVGRQEGGLRVFVYTPLYLGRDGFLQMWLHEEEGLVGASWEPMISDCRGMLRRLVRATRRQHPEVPSRTEGRMTPAMTGGDLCMAALEKGASVTVVWEDPRGTEIRVGTTPGSHRLRMRVLTPTLRELRPRGI